MMNNKIKEIATATLKKVPFDVNNFEKWMDAYLVEYSRTLVFECSDVVRDRAKEWEGDKGMILKSTAVDILDHFGL
jgi:hypothetical protein